MEKTKYKVYLTIGDKFFDPHLKPQKAEGDTLIEALANLKSPDLVNYGGTIEVKYGKLKTLRHLNKLKLNLLFNAKHFYKESLAKSLELFLK